MARTIPILNYLAAPSRTRRRIRLSLLILTSVVAGFASFRYGRPLGQRIGLLYYQHACRTYVASKDMVIFEEDPSRIQSLAGLPGYAKVDQTISHSPPSWDALRQWHGTIATQQRATAFLHERRSMKGLVRVVAIDLAITNWNVHEGLLSVVSNTWEPVWDMQNIPEYEGKEGDEIRNKATGFLSIHFDRGDSNKMLRVFAGQIDPKDAAAFSFRVQFGQAQGEISGRLQEDGRFIFNMDSIDGLEFEKFEARSTIRAPR